MSTDSQKHILKLDFLYFLKTMRVLFVPAKLAILFVMSFLLPL